MQNKWKKAELNDISEIISSGIKEFSGTKLYVDTKNVQKFKIIGGEEVEFDERPSRANMETQIDDLLLAKMQNTSKVFLITKKEINSIFSTGFAILRPSKEQVNPSYFGHILLSDSFQETKNRLCTGSTQKAINNNALGKIPIIIPKTLEVQEEITVILNNILTVIENGKKSLCLFHLLISSLFVERFGDPLKNSHNLPISTLDDLTVMDRYGPRFHNQSYSNSGIPILRTTDITKDGFLSIKNSPKLKLEKNIVEKYKLLQNDLVISRSGTIGRCTVYNNNETCIPGAFLIHFRLNEKVNSHFVKYCILSEPIQKKIHTVGRTSTHTNINAKELKSLPIIIPPIEIQDEFVKKIHQIENHIGNLEKSVSLFSNLYNTILKNLSIGKWYS